MPTKFPSLPKKPVAGEKSEAKKPAVQPQPAPQIVEVKPGAPIEERPSLTPAVPVEQSDLIAGRLSAPPDPQTVEPPVDSSIPPTNPPQLPEPLKATEAPRRISDQTLEFSAEPAEVMFLGRKVRSGNTKFLVIDEEDVADVHCSIRKNRLGDYTALDYSWKNPLGPQGTAVNGQKVAPQESTSLKDGDELTLGNVRFAVHIKDLEKDVIVEPAVHSPTPQIPRVTVTPPVDSSTTTATGDAPAASITGHERTQVQTPSGSMPRTITPRSARTTPNPALEQAVAQANQEMTKSQEAAKAETKPCPHCNEPNPATNSACSICGSNLAAKPGAVHATGLPLVGNDARKPGDSQRPGMFPPRPEPSTDSSKATPKAPVALPAPPKTNVTKQGIGPAVVVPPAVSPPAFDSSVHADNAADLAKKEKEASKSTPKPAVAVTPTKPGSETIAAKKAVEKSTRSNTLQMALTIGAGLALLVFLIYMGTRPNDSATMATAPAASATPRTTAPMPTTEPPAPTATDLPTANIGNCPVFDADLAKKYFGSDDLKNFTSLETKDVELHCGAGVKLDCRKTPTSGASCQTFWDLSAAGACHICKHS